MKPISLTMKGLRSYREQVEIVFPEHGGLMAIIGDTGAGKSSILEGVVYALFSGATWTGHVKDLIADDEDEMRVAFVFEVDGVRWRILRAHRQNIPTSTHRLENVSTGEVAADQERSVTQRACEIVGFDRETFLSAVVLPQGRFARLLLATERERSEILSHVLGLDELDAVRELADATLDRLQPVALTVERLMGQLGNPDADLAVALETLSTATARRGTLDSVADSHRLAQEAAIQSDRQAQAARVAADRIKQAQAASPATTLAQAKKVAMEIAELRGKQTASLASAKAGVTQATQSLEAADRSGAGIAHLTAAIESLNFLASELPRLDVIATELAIRRPTFEERHAELVAESAHIEALDRDAGTQGTKRAKAAEAVIAAQNRLISARTAINTLRALRGETAKAVTVLAKSREELSGNQRASTEARTEAEKQGLLCTKAQQRLLDAERVDHAAACAHGSHPGDPCPVCGTVLGKDFVAPKPKADLAHLRKAYETAEAARRKADGVLGNCEGAQTNAERTVTRLVADLETREKTATQQASVAAELLPGIDLALPDADVLEGLVTALDEKKQAEKTAESGLNELQLAVAKAKTAHAAASTTLENDERQFRMDEKELLRCATDAEHRRVRLPASFRPESPSKLETVRLAAQHARDRLEELRAVESTRHDQEKLRDTAQSALDDLGRREQSEVQTPAGSAWTKLVSLHVTVLAASQLLGSESPVDLDEAADIAGRASQAEQLQAASQISLQTLEALARTTAEAAQTSRSAADRIITEAGFDDIAKLTTAIQEAVKLVGAAEARAEHARARIEPARTLAEVCAPFKDRVDALQVVKETVTQATFVAEMRRRRETHLMHAASQELMRLSEDRYEFVVPDIGKKSDRFVIWDHLTQRERSPQTLSGGETFLASLALALGLSEILSRRSQKIESLWLDEGFASLDDNALDEAIAALERAAAGGRLIAVVTHLKKVMQSIDQVLAVQRTLKGSQAHWAGTTERARTAVEQAAAGLLT
jgi:DNA repair protein SbcC/Rad50